MSESLSFMVFNKDTGQREFLRKISADFNNASCSKATLYLMNMNENKAGNFESCIVYDSELYTTCTSNNLMFVVISPAWFARPFLTKLAADSARMHTFLSLGKGETRQTVILDQVGNFVERAMTSPSFGYPTKIQLDSGTAKSLKEFLISVQSTDVVQGCVVVVGESYLESTFEDHFYNQVVISMVDYVQKDELLKFSLLIPVSNGSYINLRRISTSVVFGFLVNEYRRQELENLLAVLESSYLELALPQEEMTTELHHYSSEVICFNYLSNEGFSIYPNSKGDGKEVEEIKKEFHKLFHHVNCFDLKGYKNILLKTNSGLCLNFVNEENGRLYAMYPETAVKTEGRIDVLSEEVLTNIRHHYFQN